MTSSPSAGSSLDGPSVGPASGNSAKHAVVFLHGYGADGNDLIGLSPYFAESLPDAAFYSPHAPLPGEMGFGRQWLSLHGYDPNMLRRDPARMAGVFAQMYDGAVTAAEPLNAYLDSILADLDLPPEALALVGFSQGTMMAMHVALRRTPQIGPVVAYSGALIGQDRLADERRSAPPILIVHGAADDVVPVQALSVMQSALDAEGVAHSAHVIPGHGHGIEQTGAALGRDFLKQHLVDRNPA